MQPATTAFLAALLAAGPVAHAQPVWRCGNSYSQQPCSEGAAIAPATAPAPADRAQAGALAARDQRLADALERQRLQRDAQAQAAPSLYVAGSAPDTSLDEYKTPEKKATRKLDVFTASVPGSGKAHKDGKAPRNKQQPAAGAGQPLHGSAAPAKPKPAKGSAKPSTKSS